jgi:hypothetical protein
MLSCADDCTFDTSGCAVCGDGVQNGEEECDGNDYEEPDCQAQGCLDCIWECTPTCGLELVYCCDDFYAC